MEYGMSHIFISYVHEDQDKVEKLSNALKRYNMDVWLDRDSIFPGMMWRDAIRQAIKNGAFFIACFSIEYQNRDKSYMNEELRLAVDELRQYPPNRPWFIPILFSECNVPAFSIGGGQTLLDFQWVDLYSDWSSGFQKLIRILKLDEINYQKELIDEFGYIYTSRSSFHLGHSVETAKEQYLETIRKLKKIYGVEYDPIKLDRS
jgi:hypothetical protein